jgi:hypothetical protein
MASLLDLRREKPLSEMDLDVGTKKSPSSPQVSRTTYRVDYMYMGQCTHGPGDSLMTNRFA